MKFNSNWYTSSMQDDKYTICKQGNKKYIILLLGFYFYYEDMDKNVETKIMKTNMKISRDI